MLCVRYGAMIILYAAVYLQQRQVKRSSSSALEQTLLSACFIAINGGVDEKTKEQVGPKYRPITSEYLDYDEVMEKYDEMMTWLAQTYVETLNMIHYMHDKYYYEASQMALIDTDVRRTFATGIAGFSHVVDSLSVLSSMLR